MGFMINIEIETPTSSFRITNFSYILRLKEKNELSYLKDNVLCFLENNNFENTECVSDIIEHLKKGSECYILETYWSTVFRIFYKKKYSIIHCLTNR